MEEIIKQENFTPDIAEWKLEEAVDVEKRIAEYRAKLKNE